MDSTDPRTLDDEETYDLLGDGGTGVLSLSTTDDDPPHSIPVSYGYDETEGTFYFRLAVEPGSEKADLLDRGVSFVVHGEDDDGWWSVVASGRLKRTRDDEIATESLEGFQHVEIPLYDVFGQHPREVAFEFFRLDPDDLTGLHESNTGV
jgi:nitroimidazol reductase NimA-like FMN-containing flavoprotein (pyridoxamine 5'-phosphate oxidase superfamily)